MLKKNSIFTKIFIPVIVVVLLQTGIISMTLFINGTTRALDDSAIDTLSKNAENRAMSLERMMVAYWSNLDKLDLDLTTDIDTYLAARSLEIDAVRGDYRLETDLLSAMSQSLINNLRASVSTGMFVYMLGADGYSEGPQVCNGLYYRDLDPFANQGDNSDLMFERGHIDTARKDRIQLGSLWSETFSFSPENADTWRGYTNPQLAAAAYPDAAPADLAYWNGPHVLNPGSPLETSRCITYTRPFFYQGRLIAIIGTEVQTGELERFFPASDFDNYGQAGYMLVEYSAAGYAPAAFSAKVFQVSGSYIRQLAARWQEIDLSAVDGSAVYRVSGRERQADRAARAAQATQAVFHPLRLYNLHAPYADEQWALAAVGTENKLFESSRNVSRGVLISSVLAALLGGLILILAIRRSTDPLISIADQIEKSERDDLAVVSTSDTYEIVLLTSTINAMRERRKLAETQVREERERYLVALESAADTFMEYDLREDSFMLYYFSEGAGAEARLSTHTIPQFTEVVQSGGFCHPEDIPKVLGFMEPSHSKPQPVEIRAKTSVFSHITAVEPDGDYYWFLLKASCARDSDGQAVKIIGTAKEITGDKLAEYAVMELRRRDLTTGLYNRDYGMELVRGGLAAAVREGQEALAGVLRIEHFDQVEAFYGRVFGGVVMNEIGRTFTAIVPGEAVVARLTNDSFLLFCRRTPEAAVACCAGDVAAAVDRLYAGENADIKLTTRMGVAAAAGSEDLEALMARAEAAARFAAQQNSALAFYGAVPRDGQPETAGLRDKPISVFLDTKRENIVSLTFELFERSSDVTSASKVLLGLLGRLFDLDRIAVCAYDASFGAAQLLYEWAAGRVGAGSGIEKIPHQDFAAFESLLDENGTFLFTGQDAAGYSEGVRKLLCLAAGGRQGGYCCEMFENTAHTGRILFFGQDGDWSEDKKQTLYEIVKIIAAHMSIEKSHSASRAKSEFLSRISHEIRTPMNAILGMADIALNSGDDPARVRDALTKIDFSAKHLLSLINDVLDMSRIESGKLQIERAPFSLNDFMAGIETLMRTSIENNGIIFTVNSLFRHRTLIGDEYRLRQVLVNLLGNAGKFTKPGGTVVFTVEELESQAAGEGETAAHFRFSVKDSGIGISMEEQLQVFKAFEQAGGGIAGRRSGTGLGLAISTNIVSAMGGKLELVSKLGEGSDFYFTLRLALAEDGAAAPGGQAKESAVDYKNCFQGKRALLVEDVAINVEIASYFLEETGIAIDVAVNGQEACDRFLASPIGHYDVILMDIQMPVMDGLTATRLIRRHTERADARTVPIIAMTANAFDEDMKKSVESGMNGHVAKPLESEKMLALMRQLLTGGAQ